ncbi:TPA: NAD-dependent epimerase/dehydratase family protein [Candidatus Woesearchaeota archaeon]|nr:NAD-dependent epimerase/dehydratase family protein [Candidatus Woesearchaeota archaeon]HII69053.1 NAD-dependent epimerase/dehydratase family protein [Candidatus Woesearchaeota archaeon]
MARVFLTGGSGLLGRAFFTSLIGEPDVQSVYALTRDKRSFQWVQGSQCIGDNGRKFHPLEGDLLSSSFAGTGDARKSLVGCDEVIHLAADTSLAQRWAGDEHPNVFALRMLLSCLKDSKKLKHFCYVSSAYACGEVSSAVPEGWLSLPAAFRAPYEQSKWECEKMLKEFCSEQDFRVTIVRPSILISSAALNCTGIRKQKTIYLFAKALQEVTEKQHNDAVIRLAGDVDATLNIVSAEEVAHILMQSRHAMEKSTIINAVNSEEVAAGALLEAMMQGLNCRGLFRFAGRSIENMTRMEMEISRTTKHFIPYLSGVSLQWESSAVTYLDGRRFPSEEEVLSHITQFCREGA